MINWSKWKKTEKTVELVLYKGDVKTSIKVPAKLANNYTAWYYSKAPYVDEHHNNLLYYLQKQLNIQYVNLNTRRNDKYPTVYI